MSGQLIPRGGGDPILLPGEDFTIGCDPSCDVVLAVRGVSGRHCRLGFRKGSWYVKDLGSKNGIRVNGKRCEKSRLPTGSTLALGAARFEIAYGSSDQTPSPQRTVPLGDAATTLPVQSVATPKRRTDSARSPAASDAAQLEPAGSNDKLMKRFLGKLTPQGGGDLIPLMSDRLIIGRNKNCDVYLAFSSVSSQHCELEFRDGYWFVRDLDSSNGTRVNGQSVTSSILMPGDILRLAKLRFEIDYKPRADAPPPEENPFEQSLLEKAGLQQKLDRNPNPRWLESDQDSETDGRVDLESL